MELHGDAPSFIRQIHKVISELYEAVVLKLY